MHYNHFEMLLDKNDAKLNTMTGIPTHKILDKMTEVCALISPNDNFTMSMRSRILLTMFRLKSNLSIAETAIMFQVTEKTVKTYFADCVQLLAKGLKGLIYWQTREQNSKSLPTCFKLFPNTMTVLDCTEVKTATFNCLRCRTCLYSHYKGCHTVKFLIGVAPSGLINFVSPAVAGKTSDKAVFNLTNLTQLLNVGDAVMVDKGFMIGDELSKQGVEMIRPAFMFQELSKEEVQRNTQIACARVHVERRIARLKIFRILSQRIHWSVLPYIDDVITVICGLSNLSQPILKDDKFV